MAQLITKKSNWIKHYAFLWCNLIWQVINHRNTEKTNGFPFKEVTFIISNVSQTLICYPNSELSGRLSVLAENGFLIKKKKTKNITLSFSNEVTVLGGPKC